MFGWVISEELSSKLCRCFEFHSLVLLIATCWSSNKLTSVIGPVLVVRKAGEFLSRVDRRECGFESDANIFRTGLALKDSILGVAYVSCLCERASCFINI